MQVPMLGTMGLSSTSSEKNFFGTHAMAKPQFWFYHCIGTESRHTSKKMEGKLPKQFFEKKIIFCKKGVDLWTNDGKTCFERHFNFSDYS